VFHNQNDREGLGAEMDRNKPIGTIESSQPLEIDIRKIMEQMGIETEKWPEEYRITADKIR
jgi:hypothetical protein